MSNKDFEYLPEDLQKDLIAFVEKIAEEGYGIRWEAEGEEREKVELTFFRELLREAFQLRSKINAADDTD